MTKKDLENKNFYVNGIYIKEIVLNELNISLTNLNKNIKKFNIKLLLNNWKFTQDMVDKYFTDNKGRMRGNISKTYGLKPEEIYNSIHDIKEKPTCKNCGKDVKFRGPSEDKGYDNTCSYKCSSQLKINKANKEFNTKADKVHKNKYDYSQVNYIGVNEKIKIICPIHGEFEQKPQLHIRGHGCPACGIISNQENLGWTRERYKNIKTILYFVKIKESDSLYKIGITKNSLKTRFTKDMDKIEVIIEKDFIDGSIAFDMEQDILKQYKKFRLGESKILKSGNTEIMKLNSNKVRNIVSLLKI